MSTTEWEQRLTEDFSEVYQDHLASVWRYVRSRVWDYHEAQDVTAEVFTRAWRAWPGYDSRRGDVAPWLFRIAQRTVVDWIRRRPREEAAPRLDLPVFESARARMSESIEAALLDDQVLTRLGWALAQLNERERDCVALRFAGGLKMAEIAEVLGTTTAAAKMASSRAIRHLVDAMAQLEEGHAPVEAVAALDELIDELVIAGRAAVSDQRLQELIVHLSAVHQPALPPELPERVAACIACAGRIRPPDAAVAAAGRRRSGGLLDALGIAPLTGFSWAALAPVCLACTVYPLGTFVIGLGLGVDMTTGLHYFSVASGVLVLWVLWRHFRRHRDPIGLYMAGIGGVGLVLHLVLHALPGLETGSPFTLSDQAGTALVLAGAFVDWLAVRRWMGRQRTRMQALAPKLAAGGAA